MVGAVYRHVAKGKAPGFAYRIGIAVGGKAKAQFDIPRLDADQFANELQALAAMIRAHAPKRQSRP